MILVEEVAARMERATQVQNARPRAASTGALVPPAMAFAVCVRIQLFR